ncbi:MAG TPA: hypothetical protein VG435_10420 [Acidimicrobiales bacterium]|jgi:hypothetical protein|nr:hypothetical protein [Acidimicrobiales bacterium]
MTVYVVLGHGGYDPEGTESYPKEVLVPSDTTLKFYSDAGSPLTLPAVRRGGELDSDYAHVAPAWQQVKQVDDALGFQKVTYNYALYPDDSDEEREAAKAADWGSGAELVMIETGKRYLCTGTPDTCPTPALLTVDGTDESVLTEARWKHNCTGILGEYGSKGHEIHWVACASFEIDTPELPDEITDSTSGPGHWKPTEDDLKAIDKLNASNVKETENKGQVTILTNGKLIVIGDGHNPKAVEYLKARSGAEGGFMTVKKAGAFGKGSVEVKGISAHQAFVKGAIGEFSDKKVNFS